MQEPTFCILGDWKPDFENLRFWEPERLPCCPTILLGTLVDEVALFLVNIPRWEMSCLIVEVVIFGWMKWITPEDLGRKGCSELQSSRCGYSHIWSIWSYYRQDEVHSFWLHNDGKEVAASSYSEPSCIGHISSSSRSQSEARIQLVFQLSAEGRTINICWG